MKIKPYYVEDAYHPGDTKACGPLGMVMRGIEVRVIYDPFLGERLLDPKIWSGLRLVNPNSF